MRVKTTVVTQRGRTLCPPGVMDLDDETAGRMLADGRAVPADAAILPVASAGVPTPAPVQTSGPASSSTGNPESGDPRAEKIARYRAAAAEHGFEGDELERKVALKLEYDALIEAGVSEDEAIERVNAKEEAIEEAEFYRDLNATDAKAYVEGLETIAGLERVEALEKARDGGARVTVTRALDERRSQFQAGGSKA